MTLVANMPVRAAAKMVGEHDTLLWRMIHHYVGAAVSRMDLADVSRLAIDETAAKRGHTYISLFVDIDERKVVFVTEGKVAKTVAAFADHLEDHGGDASHIKEVCIEMSKAFIAGVTENLTEAEITFDKFNAVKFVNDAVDRVRRDESKSRPELKGSRYSWLKNPANLSSKQSAVIGTLAHTNLKTARAYRIRLAFQEMYAQPTRGWGELFLDRWLSWAKRSRLQPMKDAALTVERHRDGILAWFDSRIANGLIEGINPVQSVRHQPGRTPHPATAPIFLRSSRSTWRVTSGEMPTPALSLTTCVPREAFCALIICIFSPPLMLPAAHMARIRWYGQAWRIARVFGRPRPLRPRWRHPGRRGRRWTCDRSKAGLRRCCRRSRSRE